jgi:hypothetical protein
MLELRKRREASHNKKDKVLRALMAIEIYLKHLTIGEKKSHLKVKITSIPILLSNKRKKP